MLARDEVVGDLLVADVPAMMRSPSENDNSFVPPLLFMGGSRNGR